jgi:hypothetical protein
MAQIAETDREGLFARKPHLAGYRDWILITAVPGCGASLIAGGAAFTRDHIAELKLNNVRIVASIETFTAEQRHALEDDSCDHLLEATAGRMDLSLGAVARALDLPLTTRPVWIRWLSRDQLEEGRGPAADVIPVDV